MAKVTDLHDATERVHLVGSVAEMKDRGGLVLARGNWDWLVEYEQCGELRYCTWTAEPNDRECMPWFMPFVEYVYLPADRTFVVASAQGVVGVVSSVVSVSRSKKSKKEEGA